MREALIVWGGWAGHEPEQCASIVEKMLSGQGFKVHVETSTRAFANPLLAQMSLIVPICTQIKIEKEELGAGGNNGVIFLLHQLIKRTGYIF